MSSFNSYLQLPPKSISTDTLCLVGIATLASAFQLTGFARKVGESRRKYKISPPRTDGDEAFVRCFRAQQNCLEFYPIFLVSTWMCAIFFHQVPAAILAVLYMFERHSYFESYCKTAEGRRQPFNRSVLPLKIMALLAAVGMFNVLVRQATDRDLLATITNAVVTST